MKTNKLTGFFRTEIDKLRKNEYIGQIYYNVFSLISDEDLETELNYLYNLYIGKDELWKEQGKEEWFCVFHKSIRQTNFFHECYQKQEQQILSDEEKSEFRFLLSKTAKKGYVKKSDVPGEYFTKEYDRFLTLYNLNKREKIEENISDIIDSILWNVIHLDINGELNKIFIKTFEFAKIV